MFKENNIKKCSKREQLLLKNERNLRELREKERNPRVLNYEQKRGA